MVVTGYCELQVTSNFSFLRGASFPEEYIEEAIRLGYRALSITDRNSLSGIVRAHAAARESGQENFSFLVGAAVELYPDGAQLGLKEDVPGPFLVLVHPTSVSSYGALSELLTRGKRRAAQDGCLLSLSDLLLYQEQFFVTLVPPSLFLPSTWWGGHTAKARWEVFEAFAADLFEGFRDRHLLSIALTRSYGHQDYLLNEKVQALGKRLRLPFLATNDVHYHVSARQPLQDVVSCIREGTTVEQAGYLLFPNGERFLKPPEEMLRLFRDLPSAIRRGHEIREGASRFSLSDLSYHYPHEVSPKGMSPHEYLKELTRKGARERYPEGVPQKVKDLLQQEFSLIRELQYEKYFLTCYDIVRFARERGILCQGRGAAANSSVCFCLGITAVDPARIDLLFARFVSKERDEPPDIDIDFEHERREEVIQYIYERYGRERAALTCEVVRYRHRSAVREVGKALGLPPSTVDGLAKSIHRWTGCTLSEETLRELGLDPESRPLKNTLSLADQLLGFPRHLSQHVGGFIVSEEPLSRIVPIRNASMEDRTIIEWNKDDIEELGMLKIDVLGLGMLTCIRKALEFVNEARDTAPPKPIELHTIPAEDPAVYEMVSRADTVGVFQIESRAQMSMLPRLQPRCFYDLVIEVAIVRPGPIQGNMVHPFLKRRQGREKPFYPNKKVEEILGKTLGVPIFQEQAMRLAIELAGFTPGEAEALRRAMAAWRAKESVVAQFEKRIIAGMLQRGYDPAFANSCCKQLKGFSEYGFPESHAASFALLVYASAWLKRHHPAAFPAALVNSQPLGFYAPSQIIQDAEKHGVTVLPIDVNESKWDLFLEDSKTVRLGYRLVMGLREEEARLLSEERREHGPFTSLPELWSRICRSEKPSVRKRTLLLLAKADAFRSLSLSQREALWEIRSLPEQPLPIERQLSKRVEKQLSLPKISEQEAMFQDYTSTRLSLRAHPLQFLREELGKRGVQTAETLRATKQKRPAQQVKTAGIMLFRQRPGTARGVVFITLEDETGMTNLIVPPTIFERYQGTILSSSCVTASGALEKIGEVVYLVTTALESLDREVLSLRESPFDQRSYSY